MRPVIPKIRVGDILLGTKNLRSWLQTSSLLKCISQVEQGLLGEPESSLCLPSKADQYVVAANAWEAFGVWTLDRDFTLVFSNPGPRRHRSRGHDPEPAMSPGLFAQWFIRTRGRRLDLSTWPNPAYYLWGSLQMNAAGRRYHGLSFAPTPDLHGNPLTMSRQTTPPRDDMREITETAIRCGSTRPKAPQRREAQGFAYGPCLRDIPNMQAEIRRIAANPRVVKSFLKKYCEGPLAKLPKEVYNIIVNQ